MHQGRFHVQTAKAEDAGRLADLRVAAMRPSLEAVGRFDPDRARDRFLATFRAEDTQIIYHDDQVAGFFVVRTCAGHLYLDHLYVAAPFQGQGIGRRVIDDLQARAQAMALPIRLVALNGSPANAFYQSCGFKFVSADNLDTVQEWIPKS